MSLIMNLVAGDYTFACSRAFINDPSLDPPKVCDTDKLGAGVVCTGGVLCPNDIDFREPTSVEYDGEITFEQNENLVGFCAAYTGFQAPGDCYTQALSDKCGVAYLSYGEYEGAEAGNPPCDKDGTVEPGMGTGKNTGRCATPCVTYRAYDERYWTENSHNSCSCLAAQNMLPSVLRKTGVARGDKYRYFLYHTEFSVGPGAVPGALFFLRLCLVFAAYY
jgi:hypothetical protein